MRLTATLATALLMTLSLGAIADEVPIPGKQEQVIQLVDLYAERYASTDHDLQRSKLRTERDRAIAEAIGDDGTVHDWVGTVIGLRTTRDGAAAVLIELDDRLVVGTARYRLGDEHGTLIEQSSPLYDILAEIEKGQTVVFSGRIVGMPDRPEHDSMERAALLVKLGYVADLRAHQALPF
ncbi:hypothetical protein [Sediminicurvatus halobius]|uniref:Uncharacterized protein n=1 Tax=Sediminicurvatus halobius TaxID=2182432 RepID=A0A2U2N1K4_9GAMM|nr:hypothetical protein [Spiribacter halobius]PWG62864.1 hypothetical protein DEM34_10890 [Spiribacter halobius]UEX76984.1 hypothetical protein LMH63_13660 [Spiribacter halobius]